MCHYTISPIRAKSQKCLLLLFPMLHLTAPRAQILVFCARTARKQGFQTSKAHKNLDFVLEKPENRGFRPQKRTKTSILCSKCPKTGVPKGKSAQKPRFCARNARKQGFRRLKAHKILELALTALFLSAYISKIVFFGNSRIFVKILYIGVRIFYGFVGQWIP